MLKLYTECQKHTSKRKNLLEKLNKYTLQLGYTNFKVSSVISLQIRRKDIM